MPAAQSHRREPKTRDVRGAKTGSAREAIGVLAPGSEVYILTFGQFSLMDAIVAVLDQTGPADVTISTWTAANADLSKTAQLVERATIRRLRMIVDRSFVTRQPGYCAHMRKLFGDECIRTARTHAKFVAVRNERWGVAIRTSMNLNENPRLENIEISVDDGLCSFLERVSDGLFAEQSAGAMDGGLPILAAIANVDRVGGVSTGAVSCLGQARI